jgi:hypothetical protein
MKLAQGCLNYESKKKSLFFLVVNTESQVINNHKKITY